MATFGSRVQTSASQIFQLSRVWPAAALQVECPTQSRIRIWIPKHQCQESIVSRLTSDYGLTVYITGTHAEVSAADRCCDLTLHGTPRQIQSALADLQSLGIRIWGKPNPDGDSW